VDVEDWFLGFPNTSPTVNAGADATINKGDTYSSSGSFTDPDADTWTATVDYGDGSDSQPLILNPDKTFALSHTYSGGGTYTVVVTITDSDGGVGNDTAVVTVKSAVIYGFVYDDVNGSGAQDSVETGIGGVNVTLSGTAALTKTTLTNGEYVFDDLIPGFYTVTETNPSGYISTTPDSVSLQAVPDGVNRIDFGDMVLSNKPPVADAGGPYTVDEGTSLTLDASGSSDPDDDIVLYEWDMDNDGEYDDATGVTATAVFNDDGTYTVGLNVTDSYGEYDTDTATVNVNDLGPTAKFSWSPEPQNEGDTIAFTDMSVSSPDEIVSWAWDFAGIGSSADQNPNFAFMDDGVYTVTLIVTDEDGSTDTVSHEVTANDLGPTAFLIGDTGLEERQTGSYNASGSISYPDTIATYEWDWDYDGVTFNPSGDTGALQTHAWNNDGPYTVAVRTTDDDGSTDIATLIVTVENPPPAIMVENLSEDIGEMGLPPSTENNLTASLDTANKVLMDSNPKNDVAAINTLEAFINKIEAQRGKKIPEEIADELIAKAQEIIEALSGGK